jgi:hypothetical protein
VVIGEVAACDDTISAAISVIVAMVFILRFYIQPLINYQAISLYVKYKSDPYTLGHRTLDCLTYRPLKSSSDMR